MKLLEIKNLRKSFGDNLVLDDINFEIDTHEVKVLIGASGSGKSTLLRCVNLLESIDDGEIFLDSLEISEFGIDKDEIRSKIGSVFQSFNLFPHLTVMQNLVLAPILVHKVSKLEAEKRATELLGRFGLSEKANQYPELLSGGQQQRVAILRAIMTKPKLLLLDEVTSALDPVLIAEVLTLIGELKTEGITMIIATHEMGFAKQVADQVLYLKNGRIVESGTPREIFESPKSGDLQEFLGALRSAGRLDI
ncbi:MAG: amino acid ABC transporter ATP-binding protein [Candidatus Nanopelagicaceae bacterium]|jgi:polar amino acid transport system ATP-binding protein